MFGQVANYVGELITEEESQTRERQESLYLLDIIDGCAHPTHPNLLPCLTVLLLCSLVLAVLAS